MSAYILLMIVFSQPYSVEYIHNIGEYHAQQTCIEERDRAIKILNEVGADSFYGKAFFFYRETGVRLREPFIATLDGNWLDIPNTSKG